MDIVLLALKRAAQDLFAPRMLALMLWPMGIALLFWGLLAFWFGAAWKAEIMAFLATTPVQDLMQWAGADWLLAYAALFLIVLLWLPAVYITALLITSLALMPLIVNHVEARHYPGLGRRRGGTLAGSVVNGLVATAIYVAAWLVLLPIWLFAPFGVLVSVLLNAWLNQRMFMYDALSEHADAAELAFLRHADAGPLYLLSALLGLLYFVPVLNLLAPVFMGLAFAHYGLEGLARRRQAGAA
jgi:CysZ protein